LNLLITARQVPQRQIGFEDVLLGGALAGGGTVPGTGAGGPASFPLATTSNSTGTAMRIMLVA
jgi:hypothetical protein